MTIKRTTHPDGSEHVSATACPFCGEELGPYQSLAVHLRGNCEAREDST